MTVLTYIIMLVGYTNASIGKSTWGSSDPRQCVKWIEKYLPAKETPSVCPGGICECATQGRLHLMTESTGVQEGFGIHTINCTHHPYGQYGLAEIEQRIQAEWGDFSYYDPFMDYNAGFWTNDIS